MGNQAQRPSASAPTFADRPVSRDTSFGGACINLNLDGMLSFLAGADDSADLSSIDYREPARNYLKYGGMTDEQIDELIGRLSPVIAVGP